MYTAEELTKKLKERNKKQEKTPVKSSAQTNSTAEKLKKGLAFKRLSTEIKFDSFESDLTSLGKTIDKVYSGWQTKETMKNTLSSVQSMYDRIGKYQEYQKQYGGTDLSDLQKSYKSIIDNWESLSEQYGGYKDKKSYDKAMKNISDMATYDSKAGKKKISTLEGYLKTAGEYKSEIGNLKSLQKTAEARSYGGVKGINQDKIDAKSKEYKDFLKTTGYSSYEEIEKALGNEKVFRNNAIRYQEKIKLGSVGDANSEYYDADYDKYVTIGKGINPEDVGTSKVKRVGGAGKARPVNKTIKSDTRYAAEALQAFLNGKELGDDKNAYDKAAIFDMLTEKEYNDIAYYIGKDQEDGGNRLEKYLESIEETLNYRRSEEIAEALKGNTFGQYMFGVDAGLDQFVTGVKNNFSDKDYIPVNQIQYASGKIREDISEDNGWWARTGYDLVNTTSNMLPSILVSSAVGGPVGAVVGASMMGASASGNAYQEMLNLGYDKGQARVYSVLVGVSEGGLQYALGGIGKLGGVSGKVAKAVQGIDNGIAKFAIRWGSSALAEGFEEAAQEVLNPLFMNIAAGYDTGEEIDWSEVAYSGLLGALSGGLMEGPGLAVNTYAEHSNNKNIGQNIRDNEKVGDVFDFAMNSPETSLAYEAYTRYANKGINAENIKDAQLGSLWQNARTDKEGIVHDKNSTSSEVLFAKDDYHKLGDMAKYNTEARVKSEIAKKTYKDTENVEALIDSGLESEENTESYRVATELKTKLDNGKKITTEEINALIKANDEAISKEEETTSKLEEYVVGMDEEEAKIFRQHYDGKTDIDDYANSFNLVAEYSKHPDSFSADHILQNKGVLPTKAATELYTLVTKKVEDEASAKTNAELMARAKKGERGIIDDSVINYGKEYVSGKVSWESLGNREKQAVIFAKGLYKALGSNLAFVSRNKNFNGAYDVGKDITFIDVYAGKSTKDWTGKDFVISTIAHELTHEMEVKSPEAFKMMADIVLDSLEKSPNFKGKTRNDIIADEIARLDKKHPEEGKHTEKDAVSEIVARACEDLLAESKEAKAMFKSLSPAEQKTLAEKIKGLIQKVLDWIDEFLAQNKHQSKSAEAKALREMKETFEAMSILWDKMLRDVQKYNQSLENNSTKENASNEDATFEGGMKLSEREIIGISGKSYGIGVYLDSNLLTGLTEDERKQMVKEFVVTELAGKHFIAYDNNVAVDIGIAKKSDKIKKRSGKTRQVIEELYRKNIGKTIKQEAVVLADELIENAKFDSTSSAKYAHGWLDNNGKNNWDKWIVFIQEKNNSVWEATLHVANSTNGEKVLYDIDPIKKVEGPGKSDPTTTNSSIHNSNLNVNTKFSDRNFEENTSTDIQESGYSYENFISKPDMKLTIVGDNIPTNRADIIHQAKKNAEQIGKVNSKDKTVSVFVEDIGRDVVIGTDGLQHGLSRGKNIQNRPIGIVTLKAGEIIKNSIRINELTPSKESAKGSYILIGASVDHNGNLYLVRSVVNEYGNNLASMDVLYAINTKKESAMLNASRYAKKSLSVTDPTISIAELLNCVNKYFPAVLPEAVLRHYGYDARPDGDLGESVLFSDREETTVYDLMGEKERLLKENENLRADFERLKERLALERKITKGNYFNENQINAVAGHLRKIANSNMDKVELMKALKDVYSFIAHNEHLTWEDVFERSYRVAESILADAKPQKVVDDYSKGILNVIRNTRISLLEEQKKEAQNRFGKNWNRHFFNRANITNNGTPIDIQWQEWASQYPDIFSPETNPMDMLEELYDIIGSLKDASETIVEYNAEEEKRWLANEIYNQYWNVSPIRTTADKYDKQIKLLNFKHRQAMKESRDAYESRLADQKKADRAKYTKLANEIRERKDRDVARAKELGRKRLESFKENAERKTRIQSITANALSLNEMLIKNSKDKHIPEIMKGPVAELLQAIDFSSKRLLEKGEPTRKDISLSKALRKVKDMMIKATNAHDELVELYGHGLDEQIEKMVDSVDNIMHEVGDNEFVINRMSAADLQTLDRTVKTIRHAVNKLNKFHTVQHTQGIANLSQETFLYLDSLGKGKLYDGLRGSAKKLLDWGNALPYYVFKRFGKGGMKIYEALQDGWDKFAFNIKKIIDYANETYTSKEVKEWSKEVMTFKIIIPASEIDLEREDYVPQYQEVQLTVPQIMAIYCLNKREQARGHLFQGGIRVADFKDSKGNIVSQADGIVFTEKDIATILNTLTTRQKEVADKLQDFMNTICTDWGNEVSMARFGYKAFGEENYFPIQSDKNNLAVNDETEQLNSLFKLLNMSFTKSIDEKANNRIVISDIFDVFAQHTSDMAKYNSLALPVLDSFKWYNYTEKEILADGTFRSLGVKQSMEKAFGKDGQNYFTTFLRDINGSQEVSRDTLGKGFFANAKIAAVGANLRVILLQPTSYARASAVIDNKYLLKALGHKPKIKRAEIHCGIALWKSMGYYDTNIQRGVEAQIKHNDTWKDKATDWSMKGAEYADKITWGYLWNACELEVREKRKDLKVGSEEFYTEIGKRLREVIYATQVVDSTMTRSQMMRSTDGRDKILTAFASEPTLAYNMLQDAYMGLQLDARQIGKKEAWKKNGKRIARIVTAYTMTNALAALVESGFDALRDDDDEEMDIVAFMKLYLSNFASDMSITAKIPYIKEIHSAIKGFSSSRTDAQWMEEMTKAITTWYKIVNGGNSKGTTAIKYSIKATSDLSGLPFYNVYRDVMATLNKFNLFTTEDLNEMFEGFFD